MACVKAMTQAELNEILEKHEKWLKGEEYGERANLEGANLEGALLKDALLNGALLKDALLKDAILVGASLDGASLERASLDGASLEGASLDGANLDFSCLPLWCGSLKVHFDDKQIIQLVYHVVSAGLYSKNTSDEIKDVLETLIPSANSFHRVAECGKLKARDSK